MVVRANETVAGMEKIQGTGENTQSSLEHASIQDGDGVAVAEETSKLVNQPAEVVVAKEKVADESVEPLPPQIVVIHEVESQRSRRGE